MKAFVKRYLRRRLPAFAVFLLCCAVFAATFYLYGFPLRAVAYPALLSLLFWGLHEAMNLYRAGKKHKSLSMLTAAWTDAMLPPVETVEDADYQRLLALMQEERRDQQGLLTREYDDRIAYYTLWAHQIKTPIAAMRLTLQNEDTPLSRRLTAQLGRIERYVEMAMAYLRLDANATDYVLRECELDTIVRGAVKKFSGEFIERHLSLDYKPLQCRVLTDEKWLGFVLEQLLSNALKYTAAGGVSLYLEAEATLCIADTGIGIAPEDLPRVFDQGFTGYNGRTDKHASGLGLFLCRRVCRNLGHTLSIESEVGKGTLVRLDLSRRALELE